MNEERAFSECLGEQQRFNRKWIADSTYGWTTEGWLYVATVVDLE